MQPNYLSFPHYLPLYLDYSGIEYTPTLICHSDLPQDGPECYMTGTSVHQGKYKLTEQILLRQGNLNVLSIH